MDRDSTRHPGVTYNRGTVRFLSAGLLLLLSVIWGSAYLFIKVTVQGVPPFTLVDGRLLLASVLLLLVLARSTRPIPRDPRFWMMMTFMGLVNNVIPFSLITWGQESIPSSLAAILTSTMPLFTIVIAHAVGRERITGLRVVGLLLGFAGVVLLIGPDLRDITNASTLGQLAVIGGASGYATATVFARARLVGIPVVQLAAGQMITGALIALPLALVVDRPFDIHPSLKEGLAWAALGLGPSGLAYLIYFWLIQRLTAVQVSVVSYLLPVTAAILGWAVLDESIGVNTLGGMVLIIGGILAVNLAMRPEVRLPAAVPAVLPRAAIPPAPGRQR